MNLFLIGWDPAGGVDGAGARQALGTLLERLPFLDPGRVETWAAPSGCAALACVSHPPEQTGGIRYTALEPARMALFSGRPIRWTGEFVADGLGPLDPRHYLAPADEWAGDLDGRCTAARYDDEERVLELYTDPLGAYPVHASEIGGARWISNNPELLRRLRAAVAPAAHRPEVLASLLGGGWSLSGDPVWDGIERLPRGAVHRFAPDRAPARRDLLPLERIVPMLGAGLDAGAAARTLVAAVAALAAWPGRPDVVPVTGGRDSRLVLAAALHAGIEFEATTGGPPGSPDVEIGRRLCEVVDIPHVPLAGDPHGDMWTRPRRAAEIVGLASGGTACVADAAGFPLGPREGPLVVWHSGQGGEVARGYYGRPPRHAGAGALAERLYRSFTGRRPGRRELLSGDGAALVRGQIRDWVREQLDAGVAAADVPDMFYLLRRMGTWAGPTHGCVEYVKDTTSPLWSHRLLPHELGLPARERALELFHLRVLERLAPELVDVPFEGGRPWPSKVPRLQRAASPAMARARKAAAELRRRGAGAFASAPKPAAPEPPAPEPPAPDPVSTVLAEVACAVAGNPSHPAWLVLDRPRVERLLAREPATLDTMSRYYVWRLAQVFWEGDPA